MDTCLVHGVHCVHMNATKLTQQTVKLIADRQTEIKNTPMDDVNKILSFYFQKMTWLMWVGTSRVFESSSKHFNNKYHQNVTTQQQTNDE